MSLSAMFDNHYSNETQVYSPLSDTNRNMLERANSECWSDVLDKRHLKTAFCKKICFYALLEHSKWDLMSHFASMCMREGRYIDKRDSYVNICILMNHHSLSRVIKGKWMHRMRKLMIQRLKLYVKNAVYWRPTWFIGVGAYTGKERRKQSSGVTELVTQFM